MAERDIQFATMDALKAPQALQIIATDEPGHEGKFLLKEDNLKAIIEKIPAGMKVGVVSVVGAFRTGKSFLLNLFLRYLRTESADDLSQGWMVSDGEQLLDGNMNEGWSIVDPDNQTPRSESPRTDAHSFGWRGGKDRQTTGIWMWSEPIIRQTSKSGEPMAVLLMDTQGMFDNETTMTLTAQIFGLSTLVASFQIYNVDKRIQEDNLQHLALFSEYGRMSLLPKNEKIKELGARVLQRMNTEKLLKVTQEALAENSDAPKEETDADATQKKPDTAAAPDSDDEEPEPAVTAPDEPEAEAVAEAVAEDKPFQRLQFLVRDWQNFEEEDLPEDESRKQDGLFASPALERVQALRADMQTYLQEVLRTRTQGDLASTREQILRCFDQLDCFMLPHPGFAAIKKNYDGNLTKIDPFFRGMVNYYVRYVFDQELGAKLINGVSVTGPELLMYMQIYVNMFVGEGAGFPKAMTVLDATAEGNNRIASERALEHYKRHMDKHAGADAVYMKEEELHTHHLAVQVQGLKIFDDIATMGMPSNIQKFREALLGGMAEDYKRYVQTNALRNPYKDVEFYILPLAIAAVALVLSRIVDWTCSNDLCEAVEDTFENVYLFIFFGILVLAWNHVKGAFKYVKSIIMPMVLARAEAAFDQHVQAQDAKKRA